KVGGKRIHAAQLRTIGGDVKLHFAEALRAILDRLRERLLGVGLRHVEAVEPGEPARRCCLHGLHLIDDSPAREQVRFRDASSVLMRDVCRRLRTKVEMQVEDRRTPFGGGVWRAEERSGGSGAPCFKKFPAVDHTPPPAPSLAPPMAGSLTDVPRIRT